ncbi:MAG: DEAD/DEAH box helicase [Chloroflexi bacterium]|nr:DEAD/DEAH box helicase [Chloroflexota bacterium]
MVVRVGAFLRIDHAPEDFRAEVERQVGGEVERRTGPGGRKRTVERVTLVRYHRRTMVVPRGAADIVRDTAARLNVALEWRSECTAGQPAGRAIDDLGVALRPYQVRAVEAAVRRVQSLVHLPCGGGKTTIGCAIVAHLGLPAVVVVPTLDIRHQWIETLRRMGIAAVSGLDRQIVGGEVAVMLPAGLDGGPAEQSALDSAAVLIVDECHRTPATTWTDCVGRCPARWRIGLTATPTRADGRGWELPFHFGPTIVPATAEDLIEAGYLVRPRIVPVATGWDAPASCRPMAWWCESCDDLVPEHETEVDGDGVRRCQRFRARRLCRGEAIATDRQFPIRWGAAMAAAAESAQRVGLVADLAANAIDAGRTVLVLLPTVEACRYMTERLTAGGRSARCLTGAETKSKRMSALEQVRAGEIRALVATRVADEGLDVPAIDVVILGEPGKSTGRALQRAGRCMRPGGSPPLVYDLVDAGPEFERQWDCRANGYVQALGRAAVWCFRPVDVQTAKKCVNHTA